MSEKHVFRETQAPQALGISACSFQGRPHRLNVIFGPRPTSRISLVRHRADTPFTLH
jgi:hypothetical protein